MIMEEFRDVPGYEGLYQVSDFGRVKSLSREVYNGWSIFISKERILKPNIDFYGYCNVALHKNGKQKTIKIHKLVAMVFLNYIPIGHKTIIDHIDNNKLNNRIDNLQIISQRENTSKDKNGYSSKYVGVHWHKNKNKWISRINFNGKQIHIGSFDIEIDAHNSYQTKLLEIKRGTI